MDKNFLNSIVIITVAYKDIKTANSRLSFSSMDIGGLLSTVMSFSVNKYKYQMVIFEQPQLSRP